MEFKEKLQLLRTAAKLSQEELAARLGLSRQSVTKWENGQSLPDLQNLIQISELFKVPIDRLVKDNDACNTAILPAAPCPQQALRAFLVRAKSATYAAGATPTPPTRPGSVDYRYAEGDFTYRDSYFGSGQFAGEEIVWVKDAPAYAMNYYGQVLAAPFDIGFLKEALAHADPASPYRGPAFYQNGAYIYHCRVTGELSCFQGEEEIYCKGETVYRCVFHGGSLC